MNTHQPQCVILTITDHMTGKTTTHQWADQAQAASRGARLMGKLPGVDQHTQRTIYLELRNRGHTHRNTARTHYTATITTTETETTP